jgi:hypothetical protein
VFALLAAVDAIGQHSTDTVFPLKFRRKGLGNHDKSTPTHFFEKDATNLSWPDVIEGLFAAVEKKRKFVQGYNKFQTEIAFTKKQKKEVESAKPVEEKVFAKMTVPELKDTLKNKFDMTPKSSARKAELVEMAMAEFRKCGMPATPTTSSKPPTVQSRVPSQPLFRAPQPSLSSHQSFAAQLSSLSPNSSVLNSNATLANNTNDSLVVENNSMLVEEPSTPLIDPSASKLIVKITMKAKK